MYSNEADEQFVRFLKTVDPSNFVWRCDADETHHEIVRRSDDACLLGIVTPPPWEFATEIQLTRVALSADTPFLAACALVAAVAGNEVGMLKSGLLVKDDLSGEAYRTDPELILEAAEERADV